MRPGVAFVPFAIPAAMLTAVLLAGCTNSTSGHPGDRSSSDPVSVAPTTLLPPATGTSSTNPAPASTTVPADVPTTGPNLLHKGERPPVMPALATEHTPAGAVAFAKFFELTIDWGYATTSTAYMKHYYEPGCVTCRSIQLGLDGAAAKHRHFIGGRMTITRADDQGVSTTYGAERSVLVVYRLTSVAVIGLGGAFINGDRARTMKDQVFLRWTGSVWRVAEMVPRS